MKAFRKPRPVTLVLTSTLLTLAIGLFAIECVDRLRLWRDQREFSREQPTIIGSPDSLLGWQYRPNLRGRALTTNRYGFRERDMQSPARPPDTYRVAFVGDSVTAGTDVPVEQTFTRRLAALIEVAKPEPRFETLNFGVTGYDALQVAETVHTRVGAFEPNELIYVMCLNDFDIGYDASGDLMALFRPPPSFVWLRLERLRQRFSHSDYYTSNYLENRGRVFSAVEQMARDAANWGGRLRVVVVPIFSVSMDPYPLAWMHQEIGRELAALRIETIDLLPEFRADRGPVTALALDSWHLSPAGHDLVARSLASRLDAYRAAAHFTSHPDCRTLGPNELDRAVRTWYGLGNASRLSVTCDEPEGPRRVAGSVSFSIPAAPRETVIAFWTGPTLDPCDQVEVRVPPWPPRRHSIAAGGWILACEAPIPSAQSTTVTLSVVRAPDCAPASKSIIVGPTARIELELPSRMRLELDNPRLALEGFWPIEKQSHGLAVWSKGRATLHIDGLWPGRRIRLKLRLLDVGHIGALRLRSADKTRVVDLNSAKASGEIVLDELRAGVDGRLSVFFESNTWRPKDLDPRASDERELGVYLEAVELEVGESS